MAREVIIRMSDDFDRTQVADEAIEFTYEGVTYIVDLTTEHADEFRAAIRPYMEAAHEAVKLTKEGKPSKQGKVPAGRKSKYQSPPDETTHQREKLREWARENGFDKVQPRGIVSDEIRQAYSAATGNPVGLNVRLRHDDVAMQQLELVHPAAGEVVEGKAKRKPPPEDDEEPNSMGITKSMREWARANGHRLSNGYVPRKLQEQYEAERAEMNGAHV